MGLPRVAPFIGTVMRAGVGAVRGEESREGRRRQERLVGQRDEGLVGVEGGCEACAHRLGLAERRVDAGEAEAEALKGVFDEGRVAAEDGGGRRCR